uniref:DUF4364 family protein n=2 Tax=Coprococcus sp. TaxID=2049024 RepID=UPI003FEF6F85
IDFMLFLWYIYSYKIYKGYYMNTDSIVLYKLIILYMLDRVDFTLTNSQISDFVLTKGYTNYFTLQEAINGLIECDFVCVSMIRSSSHYKITDKGEEALSMFENRIPYAIKQDILDYFDNQKINLKNESEIYADYSLNDYGEYSVKCIIKDRKETLVDLKFNVPTKTHAIAICDNWRAKSAEVYDYLINTLWLYSDDKGEKHS